MSVPTGIIGTILGIVGMGKAQHFHTAHGVSASCTNLNIKKILERIPLNISRYLASSF